MNSAATDFNVSGVEFVASVLLAAAVFFWLPAARLRRGLWASANLFVLWLVLPNLASLAALAVFLGSGYLATQALRKRPSAWLLSGYLVALVGAFLILKQYEFLNWVLPAALRRDPWQVLGLRIGDGALQQVIRVLGLSYMLFRQIHVLVDGMQGQIERISLWSYLNYQLNLFTLLAGPIQRYQDFDEQWRRLEPGLADPYELLENCRRLLVGVLKIGLVAPLFYKGWDEFQGAVIGHHVAGWKFLVEFLVVFYFYPVFLYFNFSGYCDIVIAACRFFGMRLPENFKRPYLARNVIDFWTRWHITLGTWIRDYLFMPMYKPVVERWPKRAPSLAPVFFFLAFLVAGAWHGGTANFLIYGALQGLGASATKIYENAIIAARGRKGLNAYVRSPGARWAAIVFHFHFQCFTLLFFSQADCGDAWQMLRGLAASLSGYGS